MFDLTGTLMAYEDGTLDDMGVIGLFQYLVNTGLAWQLNGHYGRVAHDLIANGWVEARLT